MAERDRQAIIVAANDDGICTLLYYSVLQEGVITMGHGRQARLKVTALNSGKLAYTLPTL